MAKAERPIENPASSTPCRSDVIKQITFAFKQANAISRDCIKIMEQHLSIGETNDTLALYLVSHGGDIDVSVAVGQPFTLDAVRQIPRRAVVHFQMTG